MKNLFLSCILILTIFNGISSAEDDVNILRHGFTSELGIGLGSNSVISGNAEEIIGIGVIIGLGGYLTNRISLTGNITIAMNVDPENTKTKEFGFMGPALQYWFTNRFNASFGLGYGAYIMNITTTTGNGTSTTKEYHDNGFALLFNTGYSIIKNNKHNFGIKISDAISGLNYSTLNLLNICFVWQYK